MLGLTKRQHEIVDFIESYVSEKRYSPSYREIRDFFGFSSLGSVYNHIQAIKQKGGLSELTKGARSLSLQTKQTKNSVPLIGKLKGGFPIETFAQIIMIPFPSPPLLMRSVIYSQLRVKLYWRSVFNQTILFLLFPEHSLRMPRWL